MEVGMSKAIAFIAVLALAGCASTCPPKSDGSPGKCQEHSTIWSGGTANSLPVLRGWW